MRGKDAAAQQSATLRSRAEEALARTREDVAAMPAADVQSLVHELQVHQIELEIQNEELRRAQQELEASHDRYVDLYDFAPIGYLTLDRTGAVLAVNLSAATMLGIERSNLLLKKLGHFVAPPDRDVLHCHLAEVFSSRKRQSCEISLASPDGRMLRVQLETTTTERPDECGSTCRTALTDVTERRRLEEHLRHSQKMEAIGRLASGVAHEFNNMLTVVLGNVELLELAPAGSPPKDAAGAEYLQHIREACQRAGDLTSQLLSYGRKQMTRPEVISLAEIANDTVSLASRLLGESIHLQAKLVPELRLVRADKGQIRQVLLNLILNARDAMPDGGFITIEAANTDLDQRSAASCPRLKPGPHVQLRVVDSGHGMDAETKQRAFEPFFTTKPAGRGSGLGLAVVDGIIAQAGGHIAVESAPGRGTTVTMVFPGAGSATNPDGREPTLSIRA